MKRLGMRSWKQNVPKLNQNKALGIDGIPTHFLQEKSFLVPVWLFIIKCFEYGRIPSIWQYGNISPIPKRHSKNKYVPLNYRGISLFSIFFRVYSFVLNTRLSKYLEAVGILNEEQNGFMKGHSREEHTFVLSKVIMSRLDKQRNIFVTFIDSENFTMQLNLYAGVKLNGHISNWFETHNGVRQGDTLSPTLLNYLLTIYQMN